MKCVCGDPESAHEPDCRYCGCPRFELAKGTDDLMVGSPDLDD